MTGNTAATKQYIKDQDSKPQSDSSYNNAICSQISSSLLALYKKTKTFSWAFYRTVNKQSLTSCPKTHATPKLEQFGFIITYLIFFLMLCVSMIIDCILLLLLLLFSIAKLVAYLNFFLFFNIVAVNSKVRPCV